MWDYYKEQFAKLANKLSMQIEYDYEKQLEKCKKKMSKKVSDNDIGGEAMTLAVNRRKMTKRNGGEQKQKHGTMWLMM